VCLSTVTLDSTEVAALVSAVVAFIILIADRLFIEPRKWKSRYKIQSLEKKLEVHGWLISVLKGCQEKEKRQGGAPPGETHLLESSDIINLEKIFGSKAYLLSDKLKETWYDLQAKDTYFEMMRVRTAEVEQQQPVNLRPTTTMPASTMQLPPIRHDIIGADLTEMQTQAESDLTKLQDEYDKLTGTSK